MRIAGALLLSLLAACGGSTPATGDGPATADDAATEPVDGQVTGRDPADDGDFSVTETSATIPGASQGRTLAATVYAPTGTSGSRPLVIVHPGFQMPRTQYASYARHLATWGFVAVATDYAESGFSIDHARIAGDVPAVIDWALAQSELAIDSDRIAAVGHSLGGKISVLAASLDSRIRAIVGWDPVDSQNPSVAPEKMTALDAALAVVGETTNAAGGFMPCAPSADNFATFYVAAKSPAISVTVVGADHMDWVDDPSCGFCGLCSPGTAAPELVRTVTRRLDVAWLRRHLLGDFLMEPWLLTPPEVGNGVLEIVHK